MNSYTYTGCELEIFERALNWKTYWGSYVKPFIGTTVAEVGAGIGANTISLCNPNMSWTCLEPDPALAARIEHRKLTGQLGPNCSIFVTTLGCLPPTTRFDTILYIDVLEHIQDDKRELTQAAKKLMPKGHLIVLSPAHQWLYTPFDRAIGHLRRYTENTLRATAPPRLNVRVTYYLDSVGLLASMANLLILRTDTPSSAQVRFWDRFLVPISRYTDALTGFRLGKSILTVWQAP